MNVDNVNKPRNGVVLPLASPAKKRISLDNVRRGKLEQPYRLAIFGPEKVGKTTFASGAEGCIHFGKDSGTGHLDITRMPNPETFGDVRDGLADIRQRGRALGFKTLVIDPLGWFEALLIQSFTGNDPAVNLATWGGGHGAGYQALEAVARLFIKDLETVWAADFNVILIGHASVKKFDDPEGPGYERYEFALDKRTGGIVKQWVDHILFAKREAFGKTEGKQGKAKAFGSAARMLYTEWSPAYDAGNRANLPPELPLHWATFETALKDGLRRIEDFKAQIDAGLSELADAEVEKKVRAWLAEPNVDVAAVANAVAAKLGEKRAQQADGDNATKEEVTSS